MNIIFLQRWTLYSELQETITNSYDENTQKMKPLQTYKAFQVL